MSGRGPWGERKREVNRLKLAVLISGSGTTLQNLIRRSEAGALPASVELVVSSKEDAYGLERAQEHNIPTAVVEWKKIRDVNEFSHRITCVLDEFEPDLVIMGGFLNLYLLPDEYKGRVMNIHPALIPSFCGKGYYGRRVHEEVLKYGCKVSGCTVHFVDNQYDHGPIIVQRTVAVHEGDTPEELAARVFREECEAYPQAIRLFAEGRLEIRGGRVKILSKPRESAQDA